MTRLVASALAALVLAAPAMAQDRAPFTGARIEGLAGWDRIQGGGGHDDDIGYGVGIGYDMQVGSALVGLEGEITDSNNKTCSGAATTLDPRLCLKAARDLSVGGRFGAVVGGNTLLYAKLGYTNARTKLTRDDGSLRTTLGRADLDGVRIGGGAEFALNRNMFAKAEYRYSNYEQGMERHQVMGGVGLRF